MVFLWISFLFYIELYVSFYTLIFLDAFNSEFIVNSML